MLLAVGLALAGAAGIAAWAFTGDQEIEERFTSALGIEEEEGHEHASTGPIEGDPWLFLAGLAVLGGAAFFLFQRHPF
ncbi:hypothetical protein DSECCO2_382650 [anaerobic digester metagenome]